MIIERIDIKSFGQLTDTSLDFASSVNVIEGQNEVGKSTIAAFIKYMLYGFNAEEGDSELGERAKRLNWDTGIAQGSMNVMVGDKHYLITRSTVPTTDASQRTVYKEESSIIDLETGAPAFGKLPAGEVFFGVDAELFDNTAFIGQIGDLVASKLKRTYEIKDYGKIFPGHGGVMDRFDSLILAGSCAYVGIIIFRIITLGVI